SDENTEADLGRVSRERGYESPRLEAVPVRNPFGPAEEVVAHPEGIESRSLRGLGEVADLRIRPSRGRGDDDSELHEPILPMPSHRDIESRMREMSLARREALMLAAAALLVL